MNNSESLRNCIVRYGQYVSKLEDTTEIWCKAINKREIIKIRKIWDIDSERAESWRSSVQKATPSEIVCLLLDI